MDVVKLSRWADKLMDTGKRNNLINFRDTKLSSAEVLIPEPRTLFDKLDSTGRFEVYDPKLANDEAETLAEPTAEPAPPSLTEKRQTKDRYASQYAGRMKKQSQLLLYNPNATPMAALKTIDKKAKEYIEETGVNVAYMAFGFVHWRESESSDITLHAPLLLVPIQFEQESAITPYFIQTAHDDILVNPTFTYKLEADYGIRLPEYEEGSLPDYLDAVAALVKPLQWTVTDECKIGIFSFLKINMYRDLTDNAAEILKNPNVRALLGEPVAADAPGLQNGEPTHLSNPLIELHSVVDADSSQIEAIEMAKSGKSFVLQGPPGTGKSQTITNIIAECLADGKKVLFVSEKLAALNVVYDKMKQSGLAEFCIELHSHKANKKDVIAELCRTLHQSKSVVSAKADSEITAKEQAQKQLDAYAQELHMRRPVINKSLYELYEAYAAKNAAPDTDWSLPDLPTKGDTYLAETLALLKQYIAYMPSIGEDYRKNPWYGYRNQDNTYQTKMQMRTDLQTVVPLLQTLVPLQNELHTRYGMGPETVATAQMWGDALQILATTKAIDPAALTKEHLAQIESAAKELQALSEEILANRANLGEAFDAELYQIDGTETEKQLTRRFGSFFSRLFNAEYKALRDQVLLCKKAGGSLPYQDLVAAVHKLAVTQQKSAEFESLAQSVADCLGEAYSGLETDWPELVAQLDALHVLLNTGVTFGQLPNYTKEDFAAERDNFASYAERLAACAKALRAPYEALADSFAPEVYDARTVSTAGVLEKFAACLHEIEKLDNWCYFRTLLAQLEEKQVVPFIISEIEQHRAAAQLADTFAKKFYYQWIDTTLNASPVLARFNRIGQDQAIQTFSQKDVEQFEINKAKIRAELSSHRPSLDMVASGSAMALLLREGEKKRKQKSIRALLSEAGSLIQILKPCFMMSPLSVSTFLASGAVHFDVVVFDEASQIFPEDAIGAIYRGTQLVVVGDSKQMPPSNFFNATLDADTDDEEAGDVTDFESILDLCSTSLRQLRLCWHYRSRYEQLIAFSNKNFYDGDLVTFPSSRADAPGVGVDYYHVDGIFDRRSHTNRKEAEFIVDLIYRNIEQYPDRSLGVVAFSVAQQDLIDRLLSLRRQATPEREAFFKEVNAEPFFIKNLETVQGDERDTIIFSVAYGVDAQGRLLHNFGPLNRVGGERRLNVAVTRAKCNVQLVSSMHCTDIDLKRTSAEGARLLREYLDFAENGNIALERTMSVSAYEQFDSDFEMKVYDFLRERGFTVDTQVGCSGFKIDLGLRRPDSSDYVLAIECDGATYHSSKNARDRDRLRQEILERMGWKFYRIWSTDWFRNQSVEKSRLLEAAANAAAKPSDPSAGQNAQEAPQAETFEEVAQEVPFEFPKYQAAEVDALLKRYMPWNCKGLVKEILAVEAPLSEEWLLKRTVHFFDREKVTAAVQRQYEEAMVGCQFSGILRKDGFLMLKGQPEVHFRAAGDIARDIKYIALEELADGMLQILKQNRTADKAGLYRALAQQCGVARVGKAISDRFDAALALLADKISVREGLVMLNVDVM